MLTPQQVSFNKKILWISLVVLVVFTISQLYAATHQTIDTPVERTIVSTAAILFSSPLFMLPIVGIITTSIRLKTRRLNSRGVYFAIASVLIGVSLLVVLCMEIWKRYATGVDGLAFLALPFYVILYLALGAYMLLKVYRSRNA
jgi:hypothetical protein